MTLVSPVKTNELRALHQIPPSPGWREGEDGEIDNFRFEGIEFFLFFFFFFFQPPPRLDSFLPGLRLVRWIIIIIIFYEIPTLGDNFLWKLAVDRSKFYCNVEIILKRNMRNNVFFYPRKK